MTGPTPPNPPSGLASPWVRRIVVALVVIAVLAHLGVVLMTSGTASASLPARLAEFGVLWALGVAPFAVAAIVLLWVGTLWSRGQRVAGTLLFVVLCAFVVFGALTGANHAVLLFPSVAVALAVGTWLAVPVRDGGEGGIDAMMQD